MTQKSLNVTWHDHLQHLSGLFQDLYENKKLVDVTLYCTGGSVKAHRIVLSACSPYFAKVFQENDFQHPIIILKGITYDEMHLLLEFMYKGSINILENELDSLIQAGSFLEIKGMDVKNIPSNIKNTSKRGAEKPADQVNEVTKKLKEDTQENETTVPVKEPESMQTEETPSDTTKENIESPTSVKSDTSHRRETRFKGQKRVDVHMLKKNYKYIDEIPSPKHTKKTETSRNKLNSTDDASHSSRPKTKIVSVDTIKKDKQDEKTRDRENDKDKLSRTLEKLNSDIDVVYSKPKAKLSTTFPQVVKKHVENKGKQNIKHDSDISESDNSFEDAISKIVIKDVYSTEVKSSTSNEKVKKDIKKENATPDIEKEYIPVIPDVIMNESDTEINCANSSGEEEDDHDDDEEEDEDDDNENDNDDEKKATNSDMLQISLMECSLCKKICKSNEEFIEHSKTHKSKPYKCDYCDSYFQRMSHLIRHRRKHTGEKPFSCRECGKCFSRQDKMKQHIRIHDENEYKPPPHIRKIFEPALPFEEKRSRGRPRKYPYTEKPLEKRPRGRPRKFSLPASGEHVENYDITNLPFGDFSYLTSALPDFSDLTIIPVSYNSKPVEPPIINIKKEKEDPPSDDEHEPQSNEQSDENDEVTTPQPKNTLLDSVKQLNECTIKTMPKSAESEVKPAEVEDVSIIAVKDKESATPKEREVISSNSEITITNVDKNDDEAESSKVVLPESIKHLSECTIEAVTK